MDVERRRARRVRVSLRADVDSDVLSMESHVSNLSVTGLFLRSQFLEHEGSPISVRIALPHGGSLEVRGHVVRVDQRPLSAGMGVRFDELSPIARDRLSNFVIAQAYLAPARG